MIGDDEKRRAYADHAVVHVHPPTALLITLASGWALKLISGLAFGGDSVLSGRLPAPDGFADGLGGALIIAALALAAWALFEFQRHGEKFKIAEATNVIVQSGPFRFSRNPVYLAMVTFGVGLSLTTANLWMLLAIAIFAIVLHFEVIRKEEAYLSRKFGESFEAYKRRVRCWI